MVIPCEFPNDLKKADITQFLKNTMIPQKLKITDQ